MKEEKIVYVIGHKNPDTDSICSAISYAELKNLTSGGIKYIPKRAGQINEETEYVLKRLGIGCLRDRGLRLLSNPVTQLCEKLVCRNVSKGSGCDFGC